uniref:Uncharacterized protein n=1 Tax=Fagus sylvatica TaxID=28930 RepID=A0A2N9IZF4_FAGSY
MENNKKYGVPLYSAGWVRNKVKGKAKIQDQDQDGDPDRSSGELSNAESQNYVVLAGGGGEGRSGIPNAVFIVLFDSATNALSNDPVARLVTHSDLPYRMAVHPGGDGVVCSFPNRCRYAQRNSVKIMIASSLLDFLDSYVGQQLALAFNYEGSALAAGGEDGKLRVFNWPGMDIILNEADAHKSVKDVDFSPDGKYLVSLGNSGPAKVWDVTSEKGPVSLPKENDEVFCSCRFSKGNDMNRVLYIAAVTGRGGSIVTWDTKTWKRIGSKTVVRDTISAFSVSPDGKLLAWALASVSLDSSARVTLIEEKNKTGTRLP